MSASFKVINQSDKKVIANLKIIQKELGVKATGDALISAMEIIMAKAVKNAPVDTGIGRASEYVTKAVQTFRGLIVEGGFTADYMLWNHEGTPPHKSSGKGAASTKLQDLMDWVKRKGISSDEDEMEAIAWGIIFLQKKFGTNPNPFFLDALNEIRPKLNTIIKNYINKQYPQIQSKLKR